MALNWKLQTNFPFTRVCVLGIILFFLGLASMIISIIAFVTESWGHYVATGMWGGACILASGSTAVFASRLKSLTSVKALLVCCVVTAFTSLTMLILSAGGLSQSSGFYAPIDPLEYNKQTSNLVHASLLVISVLCLSGNVLAVIVCCKYLFFEPYNKTKHRHRHHRQQASMGMMRARNQLCGGGSSGGDAPSSLDNGRSAGFRPHQIIRENHNRRHSDHSGVHRVPMEYRRGHRRSASDQQCSLAQSNSRRQRHSHQDCIQLFHPSSGHTQINNSNISRGRRSGRGSSGRDVMHSEQMSKYGHNHHHDRLNPNSGGGSRLSARSCSNQATLQIRSAPHRLSNPLQIRLPTEFDEEELPPYEPSDSSLPQHSAGGCCDCDSGDESDTENSSSTDAHSYDLTGMDMDGAEAVPMVSFNQHRDHDRSRRSCERTTRLSSSPQNTSHGVEGGNSNSAADRPRNGVRRSRTFDSYDTGAMQMRLANQRRSVHSNSELMLNNNSNNNAQLSQIGEYERLISVSPEVCAITGESAAVAPAYSVKMKIPHEISENPYVNGPCYENIHAVGLRKGQQSSLNPLSKTSTPEQRSNGSNCNLEHRLNPTTSNSSTIIVPVKTLDPSVDSVISLRSSFGSPNSAFRPVKPPSLSNVVSPSSNDVARNISSRRSRHDSNSNDLSAVSQEGATGRSPVSGAASATVAPLSGENVSRLGKMSTTENVNKYLNQGAIPKFSKKHHHSSRSGQHRDRDKGSLSWKNIPLPLSYNHSESVSNDEEKKLPSKRIPFTEANDNCNVNPIANTVSDNCSPASSSHQIPKSKSNKPEMPSPSPLNPVTNTSLSSPVPLYVNQSMQSESPRFPPQMSSSMSANFFTSSNVPLPKTKERTLITTQPLSPPTQTTSSLSSLALASLQHQDPSFLRSRPLQQKMGGNQSLLQSRREEMRNIHQNQKHLHTPRPSSLFERSSDLVRAGAVNSQAARSPLSHSSDREASWSTVDRSHPLSLSSYLMRHPSQTQNPDHRHSVNTQHIVPQPQQPRLGVQLQRRPQNHAVINNNAQLLEYSLRQQPLHATSPPPPLPAPPSGPHPVPLAAPQQQQSRRPSQLPQARPEVVRGQRSDGNNNGEQQRPNRPLFSVLL